MPRFTCTRNLSFSLLLIGIGFAQGIASAQESVNYASVSGRVSDQTGAIIKGADITAHQTETNLSSNSKSDGEGRFRFAYLKPGHYEITVRQPGFADVVRAVTLTVGSAFELPV